MDEGSTRNINLEDYSSLPAEIRKIFKKLSNPTARNDLQEFNQADIDKLIENKLIITNSDGLLIYHQAPVIRKIIEYKQILKLLYPIISLKNNIEIVAIAWGELCDCINRLAQKQSSHTLIHQSISVKDTLQIEFKIRNFLASIIQVRDQCKNNFIKTNNEQIITNTLADRYAKNQEAYSKLLETTIDDNRKLCRFVGALRNRTLHGGEMIYRISSHTYQNRLVTTILCDYEILENDKNFKSLRDILYHYYYDEFIFYLNHYLLLPKPHNFTEAQLRGINQTLKVRLNDKDISLDKLNDKQVYSLFQDKNFRLFDYDHCKNNKIPSQGQFLFQMSELLGQIYEAYKKYYQQLFHWVAAEHNVEIKSLLSLNEELRQNKIIPLTIEKISFNLDIPKEDIYNNE